MAVSDEMRDEIDFSKAGVHVRSIFDPAKSGHTTGEVRSVAGRKYAIIRLASGEHAHYPFEHLELAPVSESRSAAFGNFRFSGPGTLRRTMFLEKIRGSLTDIFYSMGSGQADFYPHQFKPVLKFSSSTVGRILIADEVGLGKTIEAIYIWKEVQARHGSRRLLVVCPSGLRVKWQEEIRNRFSIEARIVDAAELLEAAERSLHDSSIGFALIASLEGLRSRRTEAKKRSRSASPREMLADLLSENEANGEIGVFDLVIIDEAHHLRNPATATHHLGQLLAAASSHLVLLTATPIQIGSQNLFHLLSLLDGDRYANFDIFEVIRKANQNITAALTALLTIPPRKEEFYSSLSEARKSSFFADDPVLASLMEGPIAFERPTERIRVARALESRSLLGDVLTRTRKRDVIQNRVIRDAVVLSVKLSNTERELYDRVTANLRAKALNSGGGKILGIIARQRQLASSIPAALDGWRSNETLDEVIWEDLGNVDSDDEIESGDEDELEEAQGAHQFEIIDSKYRVLIEHLKQRIERNPSEKIVLFSFFRGTLKYLQRRLRSDGISCTLILGGMGEAKNEELKRFADPNGPKLLLSSETGSEGIDLQFARVVINYDLPWNPMKVEQRIGRIDRLGQKSDRIHIISFVLEGTIEEVILHRLFERIEIFRQSIGDLEDVLGDTVDGLLMQYFRDGLSDEELALRLEQNALAAENRRKSIESLSEEAPELVGHTHYILSQIQRSHEGGRWIRPDDVLALLTDFLAESYPGSRIDSDILRPGLFRVKLSPAAKGSLAAFVEASRPARTTRMHVPGETVIGVFDITNQAGIRPQPELIDVTHPAVLWLRSEKQAAGSSEAPVVAISLSKNRTEIPEGTYVFASDFWRLEGLQKQIVLRHSVMSVRTREFLEPEVSERLLDEAARFGRKMDVHQITVYRDFLAAAFHDCEKDLESEFADELHLFRVENEQRVRQAEIIAEERAKKKLAMLETRLADQLESKDERRRRAIPMTEGQIRKLVDEREQRLFRIRRMQNAETVSRPIIGGLIDIRN